MHLKYLSLITATLLLSLTSPLELAGTGLRISDAAAWEQTAQDRKAEAVRLYEEDVRPQSARTKGE